MLGLTMFTPRADRWELASETFVRRAVFGDDGWVGEQGWRQDFTTDPPTWTTIAQQPAPGLESPDYFTTEPPDAEMMSVGRAADATSTSSSRAASTRRRSRSSCTGSWRSRS